jgi:hypothetical protein
MTMGEMRKRVRNIGEYVTRCQIEAVEREKRMKLLGITPPHWEEVSHTHPEEGEAEEKFHKDASDNVGKGVDGSSDQVERQGETADVSIAEADTNGDADAQTKANLLKDSNRSDAEKGSGSAFDHLPLSMQIMEELTRGLIDFQKRFGVGAGSNGSLSNSHTPATVS